MTRFQRFMRSIGFMVGPFRECKRPAYPVDDTLQRRQCLARETLRAAGKDVKADRVQRSR